MAERRPALGDAEPTRIPVVEERAVIGKERHETGRVRVHTRDRTLPRELEVLLKERRVEVTSVPRDELLEERPEPRQEGETFIFPVAEEVVVVETRWRLVEEVRVAPVEGERAETVPVELARREVVIEREQREGSDPTRGARH